MRRDGCDFPGGLVEAEGYNSDSSIHQREGSNCPYINKIKEKKEEKRDERRRERIHSDLIDRDDVSCETAIGIGPLIVRTRHRRARTISVKGDIYQSGKV